MDRAPRPAARERGPGMERLGRTGRAAILAACVIATTARGSDPAGNEHVEYSGGVLRVERAAFEPEPSPDDKAYAVPGRTILQPLRGGDAAANEARALDLVQRCGLSLQGRSQEGWLLVKVPPGYERQWAAASTTAGGGRMHATTDTVSSPTPVAPHAAAPAAAPVPTGEPGAADVERLAIEPYARIDEAGGLPLTVTATGQSFVVDAKLFEARKTDCTKLPLSKPGQWECTAALMVGSCKNDCDPALEEPLSHNERIRVRVDAAANRFALDP